MSEEKTMLLQIVSLNQIGALRELLSKSKNLDVNQKDETGNFAAIIAARNNELPMLELLVKHGAKLDLKDGFRHTALGWAKKHKNDEMIKYIQENLALSKTSKHPFFSKTPPESKASTFNQQSSPNSNRIINCG